MNPPSKKTWMGLQVLRLAFCLVVGQEQATTVGKSPGVRPEPIVLDPICRASETLPTVLAAGNPAPSTRAMAERLQALYAHPQPSSMEFLNDRAVLDLEARLKTATSLPEVLTTEFQLSLQQLNSGHPDDALNTLAALEFTAAGDGGQFDVRTAREIRSRKGMAYLRLGEQENCLLTHNADSCLFPLSPNARHLLPRGSRGALAQFTTLLKESPQDLGTRWLLNLAHMTLGEYPAQVDPRYLIPPTAFASEYDLPRFREIGEQVGMDVNDLAGGVIIDDFDNDGLLDVIISSWDARGQLRYFHNQGDGTFVERTSEAGLVGEVGALNIQQTDYNNDGWLDIWLLRGGWNGKGGRLPKSLLRNNRDGTFTDVTVEAGLLSFHPTQTSRWFDFDGDGWLDLFVGNESTDAADPDPCELYHNNRDGTFTECSVASGIRIADFVKGVACADYDNDGRPDLFLSLRRTGPMLLLHNDGPDANGTWHFSDATLAAGITTHEPGFATFFFDYDNDGWEDLVQFGYLLPHGLGDVAADYLGMANPGVKPKVYHNLHNGTFSDVTTQVHLHRICHSMSANYGDLDNDGWLDFYCGTGDPDFRTLIPKRMYRNAEGRFFQDVTTATGTGHIQKGHGIAFADLDDDGDQDVYISLGGAYSGDFARNALFENPGNTNHWIKLRLVGVKANRAAVGARVQFNVMTPNGPREIHRTVSSGGSFGSNPFRLEVGLGDAVSIQSVQIRWPGSDTRQTLEHLELDRFYEVREGDPPKPVALHPVRLGSGKAGKRAG